MNSPTRVRIFKDQCSVSITPSSPSLNGTRRVTRTSQKRHYAQQQQQQQHHQHQQQQQQQQQHQPRGTAINEHQDDRFTGELSKELSNIDDEAARALQKGECFSAPTQGVNGAHPAHSSLHHPLQNSQVSCLLAALNNDMHGFNRSLMEDGIRQKEFLCKIEKEKAEITELESMVSSKLVELSNALG